MYVLAKVDTFLFLKKYRPKATIVDKINVAAFLESFRGLVGQLPPLVRLQTDYSAQVTKCPPSHTLNANITLVKFLQALKTLQRNKDAGLDGMKVKFILDVGELLHMPLLIVFNYFLAKGFPEALSTRVVHAFFKGGDAFEFDNYKGTTVRPILAKFFVMILDKRLSKWVEQHGLNNMGCVPRVKLGFTKITALLTNSSYCGL
jgi:hypothetical protein